MLSILYDNISISRTFNVFDICPFNNDQSLHLKHEGDSRLSLSQVERINMDHVITIFVNHIDKDKHGKKLVKIPGNI